VVLLLCLSSRRVAEGLLHCCFGRHTPLGRAHLCWVPDCVSILFQLLVLLSVLTHMRTLFSDLNVTGAAVVAAAAAVTLTLTVGLRLICTCRHDTGCTCMLVLTRLCHPRAFPPPKKRLRPTNKSGNQTNSNTPKDTHKEHTNQHAKAEGQRDRAASCDGNKPHPKPTTTGFASTARLCIGHNLAI
jgi:hypothetical protein